MEYERPCCAKHELLRVHLKLYLLTMYDNAYGNKPYWLRAYRFLKTISLTSEQIRSLASKDCPCKRQIDIERKSHEVPERT